MIYKHDGVAGEFESAAFDIQASKEGLLRIKLVTEMNFYLGYFIALYISSSLGGSNSDRDELIFTVPIMRTSPGDCS